MMDHKSWWKKRTTEKSLVGADKVNLSQKGNEEEIQTLLDDKAELERDLKILNEKLSSALSECITKEELVEKHAQTAHEALAGWEKAKAEAASLTQELDKALQQRLVSEERLTHLDMALKECMQQLRFVREEQEQRIHDAVMKTSIEFEKARIVLEDKLVEANKRLAKLGAENTQLSKALLAKEKLIEEINEQRTGAEADFTALMTRLESMEKESASLKYEVRVLEKELEIRNEEREFNRRTADAAHKEHLETAKKIAKLESECQRLRILVRKRLPSPAAVAKMRNEVEVLGRDLSETRRTKQNPFPTGSMDFSINNSPDTPSKRINLLTTQLCAMEEENRCLKESLAKKTNELQYSRIMYARTASKLSQAEIQLEESSKDLIATEPAKNIPVTYDLSLASMSDMGSDDKDTCAESWASALISELEHFKNGKHIETPSRRTVGGSDIDLMDDFAEMERLTIVSMDKPCGSPRCSSVEGTETQSGRNSLAAASRMALQRLNHTKSSKFVDPRETSHHFSASNHSDVSNNIYREPSNNFPLTDSANGITSDEFLSGEKTNQKIQSSLSKSISRMIELIEGIGLPSSDSGTSEMFRRKNGSYFPYKNPEAPSGYMVRVLQWKTSELSDTLHQFIQTCNDLLIGKVDLGKFAEELTSALDWVINHCFSLQDVSSMRDEIRKQFDWDESRSESEVEGGMLSQYSEVDKLSTPGELSLYSHIVSTWSDRKMEQTRPNVREESQKLKDELVNVGSANKDLEVRLQSEIDKNESLTIQLQESEEIIKSLQTKLETINESKSVIKNQIGDQKLVNEDLERQLMVARFQQNEARQRCSSLEAELENKINCCQELEAQIQLESVIKKEIPKNVENQEEEQLQPDWEIKAASEKLAECQETILNLGKHLKALASPKDAALFDKLSSSPLSNMTATTSLKKGANQRSSLLDKMMAEDNSPTRLDDKSYSAFDPNIGTLDPQERFLPINRVEDNDNEAAVSASLAIVPTKKKGGGLLKKLFWRRKKVNSKKMALPFAA